MVAILLFGHSTKGQTVHALGAGNAIGGAAEEARPQDMHQGGVPRLIRLSGTLRDLTGKPLIRPVDVTFSLYKEEEGGEPLWWETQTVEPDQRGHYSVLLGSMHEGGVAVDIFVSAEARWLEVSVGTVLQAPRVLLVSVPYALKAADAETLGGRPPSAFVLAKPSSEQPQSTGFGAFHGGAQSDVTASSKRSSLITDNLFGLNSRGPCTYSQTWAVNCNALGTDQNINLMPSGKGLVNLGSGALVDSTGSFLSASGSYVGNPLLRLESVNGPVQIRANGFGQNVSLASDTVIRGHARVGTLQNYYFQSSGGANFGTADSTSGLVVYPGSLFHGVYAELQYTNTYTHNLFGSVGEVVIPAAQTNAATSVSIFGSFGDVDYYSSAPAKKLVGVDGEAYNEGNATVSETAGVESFVGNFGAGTITNAYGFRVEDIQKASGAITNAYGLYVPDLSLSAESAYAVYADGATRSFFGGEVGVGTKFPTQALEINGGMRLNGPALKPACDAATRGTFWVTQGGAGVKDNVEVCAKDATDNYAWRALF